MCGILGYYSFDQNKKVDQDIFNESLLTIIHRGPDFQKCMFFNNDRVALGHARLSIIDLSEMANQPLNIDKYYIVFNGEIYNYLELREELKSAGYDFRTTGDTEVLLRAYQHWGEDCVKKFNGMWAFAIYDEDANKLFCSRDRFGIKPFNFATFNGQFIFSSEIKAIISYFPELRVPDYNVIANFCRTSIGAQIKNSWFKNVFRLEPAHNLTIDSSGLNTYRYWDYPRKINKKIVFEEAVGKYRELLSDSVKLRMRSDVPVGFTLSSGIDSSSLVCLLKNQFDGNKNTYTAAFSATSFDKLENQRFKNSINIDEPALVKSLTEGLDLKPNIIEVNYDNYVADLRKIIYYTESGHGSPAIFPLSQILKEAKKDVTVVLEGQGADEMLGGYITSVFPVYFIELIGKFKFAKAYKELKFFSNDYSLIWAFKLLVRQSNLSLLKKVYYHFSGIETFYKSKLKQYNEIKDHPIEPSGFDNKLNKYLYKEHTGGLVNLLHYGDAISMMNSMESRLPFMDYRLVEFAFTLPASFKVRNGMGKYIHRIAMQKIVPDYIINNRLKFGFDSPLSSVFAKEGDASPREVLLSDRCLNRGLFSKPALIKAFEEQKLGKKNHSRFLYRMLSVELWFREFIDNNE